MGSLIKVPGILLLEILDVLGVDSGGDEFDGDVDNGLFGIVCVQEDIFERLPIGTGQSLRCSL